MNKFARDKILDKLIEEIKKDKTVMDKLSYKELKQINEYLTEYREFLVEEGK